MTLYATGWKNVPPAPPFERRDEYDDSDPFQHREVMHAPLIRAVAAAEYYKLTGKLPPGARS